VSHRTRVAACDLCRYQRLAERVRHRQPSELEVTLVEDVLRLDRRSLVHPRAVPQTHSLGAAGGPRGVDERGELVGPDLLGGLADGVGVLAEIRVAER